MQEVLCFSFTGCEFCLYYNKNVQKDVNGKIQLMIIAPAHQALTLPTDQLEFHGSVVPNASTVYI